MLLLFLLTHNTDFWNFLDQEEEVEGAEEVVLGDGHSDGEAIKIALIITG